MWMTVGERRFAITLSHNPAARAFSAQLPLTVDMSELNGNEQHADLDQPLPANESRPGTIRNGDVMLYGTRTLVVSDIHIEIPGRHGLVKLGRIDSVLEALHRAGPVRVIGERIDSAER